MAHAEQTMLEPEIRDVVRTLVNQQLEVLAGGSRLASLRKEVGELKKARDGTIAELARLQVKFTHMELPFGLVTDGQGYVVAADAPDEEEDDA